MSIVHDIEKEIEKHFYAMLNPIREEFLKAVAAGESSALAGFKAVTGPIEDELKTLLALIEKDVKEIDNALDHIGELAYEELKDFIEKKFAALAEQELKNFVAFAKDVEAQGLSGGNVSISLSFISFQFDDVFKHIAHIEEAIADGINTPDDIVKFIQYVWPDQVSLSLDAEIELLVFGSSDLGLNFTYSTSPKDLVATVNTFIKHFVDAAYAEGQRRRWTQYGF